MDKRISYKMVFDCETCPIDDEAEDVNPYNMLAYDYGWAIVDKRGNVYKTRSFVNADIFLDEKVRMKSAYYADKLPQYWKDIKSGNRILAHESTIKKALMEDIREYEVTQIFAHNMRFDYCATNKTAEWVSDGKYKYFFPKGMEICDTLKMSRDVITKTPTYKRFCENHDLLTKDGRVRATAEALYRYISTDCDFEESHTGLEDVLIEKEILRYCYAKHKKMRKGLWEK